jgi:hypothetical protein
MGGSEMASIESDFAKENVARLLSRYELAYYKEDKCIEYFIKDKTTNEQISYAIVFSLNRDSKDLHVSRFCPELYKQFESKYLSAACFYLLIHHFGNIYHLGKDYSISLDTLPATYKVFFSRLKDFDLRMKGLKFSKTAEVLGKYPLLNVDTSMIVKKTTGNKEIPFLV